MTTRSLPTRTRGVGRAHESSRDRHFVNHLSRREGPAPFVWPGNAEVSCPEDLLPVAGCTGINGSLVIKGQGITALRGLCDLVQVQGDLIIEKTSLEGLNGLSRLRSVGGDVCVGDNPRLRTLEGLEELSSVGRSVFVWANDRLEDLDGLDGLGGVPEHLEIWGNRLLKSLAGLARLRYVGRDLSLGRQGFGNSRLLHLDDLVSLESVGGDLSICFNAGLEQVDVLKALQIGGRVRVEHNERLSGVSRIRAGGSQRKGRHAGAACVAPWRGRVPVCSSDMAGHLARSAEIEGDNRPPTR